jgi:isoquinoline 1-oxidoreductase alpha subunit
MSRCGACTVHVDGEAKRTCTMPVSEAEGSRVTTIEGLSPDGTHPLQLAWQELDVPQCGYCQAGQIMAAAALLERTPKPTEAEIDAAMNQNICRCATYLRIREAIHRAAGTTSNEAGSGRSRNG